MADFMPGLELGERFYIEAARPIIDKYFPRLRYSAGMLGWSSEVLGYDDVESMDHNWGPRFQLFLSAEDYETYQPLLRQTLSHHPPLEFRGYSTNFGASIQGDQLVMTPVEAGPVNHKIDIETIEGWFESNLGCNPLEVAVADWLTFSEHKLLAFTSVEKFSTTDWKSSNLCAASSAITQRMCGSTCSPVNGKRFLMKKSSSAEPLMWGTT